MERLAPFPPCWCRRGRSSSPRTRTAPGRLGSGDRALPERKHTKKVVENTNRRRLAVFKERHSIDATLQT